MSSESGGGAPAGGPAPAPAGSGTGDSASTPNASAQSRPAQKLEESQELDQKISSETDSLRTQIAAKNKEIETKTKDLNKLVGENEVGR